MGSTEAVVGPGGLRDSASALPPRPPTKRSKVTLVACQPCQQRKHKVRWDPPRHRWRSGADVYAAGQCDGARPVCSQCAARKRSDCAYDAAGDQRRTSALKQRIRDLETHARDLQDIVAGIGSATDKETATAMARQLADEDFRRTAEVAQALRRNETPKGTFEYSGPAQRRLMIAKDSDAGDYAMLEASPSSVETMDHAVDPSLPYWPIDATEGDLQLGQNVYDSTQIEVREPRPAARAEHRRRIPWAATSDPNHHPHRHMCTVSSQEGPAAALGKTSGVGCLDVADAAEALTDRQHISPRPWGIEERTWLRQEADGDATGATEAAKAEDCWPLVGASGFGPFRPRLIPCSSRLMLEAGFRAALAVCRAC